MTLTSRRTATFTIAAASALALAAPAFASTTLASTSLNLRAGKSVVKAHHHDTFTATLTSHGKAVANQPISLQERVAPTTGHRSTWGTATAACTTDATGRCQFTVTPTIAPGHHTQKDQFRAVYAGDNTTYQGSHSEIITVTVKRVAS